MTVVGLVEALPRLGIVNDSYLPAGERDQLTTRSAPRFAELRAHVYELIQKAKKGERPAQDH